ncbi:hypothetical protein [Dongshaea marina]|uniref:hypothetical protein n=1 Tax=Dongshaea marina TaxID=2047966 RepID=UPI000D3EAB8B|nr:hypothetical protein [Dongshaea marina]
MDIQSAFNSGVEGLKNAQLQASEAAQAIADQTSPRQQEIQVQPTQETQTQSDEQPQVSDGNTNITQELVELRVAENQAKASANVVKTADEVAGTLIDVRV